MQRLEPGLHKFIHHIDHIKSIIEGKPVAPIHVSVWPTLRCQFKCHYCCCRNVIEENKTDLDFQEFKNSIDVLHKYGTKAIEFSGGGEPLLWPHFNDAVDYISKKGIKMSLITNGADLSKIPKEILSNLSWIRISYQSVNHAKSIDYKYLSKIKYNASYIVSNDKKDFSEIEKIYLFVKEKNIITRIAVQRPSSVEFEKQVEIFVEKLGSPLFFSKKQNGSPMGCYMAWIRAAIDWNGNFLPCPSMQLNSESEGKIPEYFKLCHISNLEEWIVNNPPKDLKYRCSFCNCGKEHNDFICKLKEKIDDVEFV